MVAKHLSGLPLIVHIHATEFDRSGTVYEGSGDPRIHDIEYMGMMTADKVIAVSQRTKDIIVNKYQIDPNKISVVHNIVDIDSPYINGARSGSHNEYWYLEKMKEAGYTVVANIGRQTIQKGLTHLLESAKIAIEHNPKILFLFVGSGDQHEELIRLSADLGISENVIFTGFQNGSRLRDAYSVADIFVMPSTSEPFGATALEAMGLGAPVMISNQSGVSEMLTNVLKVDFWDTHEIANKIVAISRFPSLRYSLQHNGLNEFDSKDWDRTAHKTHGLYHELVGSVV
ncbi:MAG: glycosyltransferase family 4 protein, partial [Candidatus Saccharimonadales bacterium]|nr:glycosyltransferase family 4 protein [Candidatus Saccharimonadales bacterium]